MAAKQKQQPDQWMLEAFATSRAEFSRSFKNADKYDLSQYTSAEHVYNTADAIQQKQGKALKLRALARIKPYLDCLSQYQGVIEVFVQVQPDILALVWVRLPLVSPCDPDREISADNTDGTGPNQIGASSTATSELTNLEIANLIFFSSPVV